MKTFAEIEREVEKRYEIEERNVKICIGNYSRLFNAIFNTIL